MRRATSRPRQSGVAHGRGAEKRVSKYSSTGSSREDQRGLGCSVVYCASGVRCQRGERLVDRAGGGRGAAGPGRLEGWGVGSGGALPVAGDQSPALGRAASGSIGWVRQGAGVIRSNCGLRAGWLACAWGAGQRGGTRALRTAPGKRAPPAARGAPAQTARAPAAAPGGRPARLPPRRCSCVGRGGAGWVGGDGVQLGARRRHGV